MTMTDVSTVTTTTFMVSAVEFTKALAATIPFASTEKNLPALNTVYVEPHNGAVRLVATNRFVLGEYTIDNVTELANGGGFMLSLADAKQWLTAVKAYKRDYSHVTISVADGTASLTTPDDVMSARTVEGNFPPHDKLFPANAGEGELSTIGLRTDVLAVFAKALPKNTVLRFAFAETDAKPVTVTAPGVHEFRGIVMPACVLDK